MRDIFRNRIEAGQLLAGKLMRYANQPNVIVLGVPESVKKSGVDDQCGLRDVCSATVRRPWDSRRSTPDLLTLSSPGLLAPNRAAATGSEYGRDSTPSSKGMHKRMIFQKWC